MAVLDGIWHQAGPPLAGRGLGEETAEQDKTGDHRSDGLQILFVAAVVISSIDSQGWEDRSEDGAYRGGLPPLQKRVWRCGFKI
jgi:hypothetical protein